MRRHALTFASLLIVFSTPAAFGQIVFQPVRAPYTACGQPYLYGGSSPAVHDWARLQACDTHHYFNKHNFDGGQSFGQPSPYFGSAPVYTDRDPYIDARVFGYDENDAINQANARIPLYFRKIDLVRAGTLLSDGSVEVRADAHPVRLVPSAWNHPTTHPSATKPGSVIIIPKNLLNRPLKSFEKRIPSVASAQ